jgi:type I restriction enzyme R subunit
MYAVDGIAQFTIPDVFDLSLLSSFGNVREIATLFGGTEKLRSAVQQLQALLYAA